jgi:hypothetical protein
MIHNALPTRGDRQMADASGLLATLDNHVELYIHFKPLKTALELRYSMGMVERHATYATP